MSQRFCGHLDDSDFRVRLSTRPAGARDLGRVGGLSPGTAPPPARPSRNGRQTVDDRLTSGRITDEALLRRGYCRS